MTAPRSSPATEEAAALVNSAYDELCVRFSGVHSDDIMDSILLRLHAALKKLGIDPTAPYIAPDAPVNELVAFFRGEGYSRFGWNGDERGWPPERTAIEAMRELMAIKQPGGVAQASMPAQTDEPVCWIVLAKETDNIRIWWRRKEMAEEWAKTHNAPMIPLYAHPRCAGAVLPLYAAPSSPAADSVPVSDIRAVIEIADRNEFAPQIGRVKAWLSALPSTVRGDAT